MNKRYEYSYIVLRYVHDITTGEFVNVGVVLFCRERSLLLVRMRSGFGRVRKAFPDVDTSLIKSRIKCLEAGFANYSDRLFNHGALDSFSTVSDIAFKVLPVDDSSFQWSQVSKGVSNTLETTFDHIFKRYVSRYDEKVNRDRHLEADVWRTFKRDLEIRNVHIVLSEKVISSDLDEVNFQYTWKNGIYHCFEPVSFDLASADGVREKAHKWLGKLAGISKSQELFKVYLLLGSPRGNGLDKAYRQAINLLKAAPVEVEVFDENESGRFAVVVSKEVEEHARHSAGLH